MKAYQVIGGQYEQCWYGESDSLHGARVIAGMNKEYWDNWQGWHTPQVYKKEDCKEIECHGWLTKYDGEKTIVHNGFAIPVTTEEESNEGVSKAETSEKVSRINGLI